MAFSQNLVWGLLTQGGATLALGYDDEGLRPKKKRNLAEGLFFTVAQGKRSAALGQDR